MTRRGREKTRRERKSRKEREQRREIERGRVDKERGTQSAMGRTSGFFASGGENRTERGFQLEKRC